MPNMPEADEQVVVGEADASVVERPPREVLLTDPTALYHAIADQLEVHAFRVFEAVPTKDPNVVGLQVKNLYRVALFARWKDGARDIRYAPPSLYVPSSLPATPRDQEIVEVVKEESRTVVSHVTHAAILDAKANFLREHGHGKDKVIAEKLVLRADLAFMQAHLAQLGVKMNTQALSWFERTNPTKARIFWKSLFDEIEERNNKGQTVTLENLNGIVEELRTELGIGREKLIPADTQSKPSKPGLHLGAPVILPLIPEEARMIQPAAPRRSELGRVSVNFSLLLVTLGSLASGVVACTSRNQPETPPPGSVDVTSTVTGTETATAPIVGVITTPTGVPSPEVPTPTVEAGQPVTWRPPTLAEAKSGVGGPVPVDVGGQMAEYEGKAQEEIPGAVTVESSWNQKVGDEYRLVTYARDSEGNIVWLRLGEGFDEYPIRWEYDSQGNIRVVDGLTYDTIPDSKDAVVIFTSGGEKPAVVKDVITLPDGTQVYMRYWDGLAGEWKTNPNLPEEVLTMPEGATGKDSKGNYIKTVEEDGYTYEFTWDKEQENWVRPLGKMYGWDWDKKNGFPVRWFVAEGVPGGNIKEIVHQDFVSFDDRSLLSDATNPILQDRLGLSNSQMTNDLFDKGVTFSYSVDGVSHEVVFDKDTGIKVFIVPPESLEPFVGEGGVSLVTDNISFKLFSKLVGIDKEDELVFVVASPVPLDQLSERWLRVLLFLNVGNFLGRENQTRQALTTKVGILATTSSEIRANGKPTIDIIWNK